MSMSLTTNEYTLATVKPTRANVIFSRAVFGWIDRKFKDQKLAAKKLADFASFGAHQVSARTVEAWLHHKAPPCLTSLEIMAARCEELAAELEQERGKLRAVLSK
jgi:hypothetical protein